jgi:hypothetical protein
MTNPGRTVDILPGRAPGTAPPVAAAAPGPGAAGQVSYRASPTCA